MVEASTLATAGARPVAPAAAARVELANPPSLHCAHKDFLKAGSVDTLVTLDLSFLGTLLRTGKLSPAHVVFESFDVKRAQIFFELKAGELNINGLVRELAEREVCAALAARGKCLGLFPRPCQAPTPPTPNLLRLRIGAVSIKDLFTGYKGDVERDLRRYGQAEAAELGERLLFDQLVPQALKEVFGTSLGGQAIGSIMAGLGARSAAWFQGIGRDIRAGFERSVQAARKGAAVASTDPAPPPVGAGAPSGETPLAAATAGATPRAELLKATQKQVAAAAGPLGPKWKLASSGAKSSDASAGAGASAGASGSAGGSAGGGKPASAAG
ncbi:hypothetical protein EMIHUDRAFT_450852 [Emiliania huxleyi CCMP1516]|uniref:Uncharacterized protein n=2 Tax=Emiliania huxleyi TaxID=2903 RepID=A0A0D3JBN7_EMIH1|nr:hypothetical protein EMIHUDRAFT_450852 [Emiliania huxleyi CCMP1516]EOD20922.1 hypothetical protein EMIHUDRAFT_450852 [Emiliania huxleyi CCMP1516]|eukprot:XP_005773351.1 hypothetical protein EMIHUDRAFT_450852 [Emiliania huxleyi CCMP1516]